MKAIRWIASAVAGCALIAGHAVACAAERYPSKPIRIIVGGTAGSSPDVLTRLIGNDLASSSFTYSSMLFPSLASTSISFLSLDVGSLPGLAYSSITFDTVLTQYEGTEYSSWTFYTIGFANGDGDGFWNLAPSSLLTADFGHSASWSNVSAVPEPETYAMMIAGLGLLGFAARRRKQQQAAA